MSLFRRTKEKKRVLIFHIGSSTILGAHVLFDVENPSPIPEITHTVVTQMKMTAKLTPESLVASMQKAVNDTGHKMVQALVGSPDKIICFLESPWYAAQVRTVTMSKRAAFSVTEKLVQDLIKKETELFEREYVRESNDVLIERAIASIKLNGYTVTDPYAQKASELEIGLVLSVSPQEILSKIQAEIGQVFHRTRVTFRTFAHAGSVVTSDLFLTTDTFIFTSIGGELTDVVLVKNNVYAETISFPFGTHTLIRTLAESLGQSLEDAEQTLSLYLSGNMEKMQIRKIERALTQGLEVWSDEFGRALSKIAHHYTLPHTVALLTDPLRYASLFKKAIQDESRVQHTLTAHPFTVVALSDVSWNDFVRHANNPHPKGAIAALLVAKYTHNVL